MEIVGQITVPVSRPVVFEEMQKPETLERAIPNCESLEQRGEDVYHAVIDERIAGVSMKLELDIEITALREPEYVEIAIDGEALGGNTGAAGTGTFELSSIDDDQTEIDYAMDISVSGKLASLGFKMLNHVVEKRVGQMGDNIEKLFE